MLGAVALSHYGHFFLLAVLRHGKMIITVFTRPPGFHVRVCFDGHGYLP